MPLFTNTSQKKSPPTKEEALAELDALDKDFLLKPNEEEFEGEFEKWFDEKLKNKKFKAGQVVEGAIVKLTDDHVIVDIGYKSEGMIPRSEFHHFKQEDPLEVGQKVDVYIEQTENKHGMVVLSKDKANIKKVWQDIIQAKENDEIIQGKVVSAVKGGLSVDIGIKAFLPGSQIDIRPVRNLPGFVGQTLDFKIIKINHKRGNVVLSRRPIIEKDREKLVPPGDIKEGAVVKGFVKNITDYGAFIDLGDRDGLLHITDMSWSRVEHPGKLLKVGQELDLKVLKFDMEKNRISLGLKQLNEEKWEEIIAFYKVGSVVKGKVSSLVDYGAFILLDKGLEGLAHINELSWTRKTKHPSQILKVGQELDVKILDIKKESRKLSLSVKKAQDNPWLKIKDKFSVGQVGEFEVVSVSDFGLFVRVDDMIDGLIRVSDISWTEEVKLFDRYKIGDKVKAKILDIDPEGERFSLGIKQLEQDPWSLVEENYPIGSHHEVEVTRVVDFGAFVRIQENIEGLIHISELSKKRVIKPQEIVQAGDKVTAEILSIDKSAKKIGLSIRLVELDSSGKGDEPKSSPKFIEGFFAKALKKSIKGESVDETNKEDLNPSARPPEDAKSDAEQKTKEENQND